MDRASKIRVWDVFGKSEWWPLISLVAVLTIASWAYYPALNHGYVWDDISLFFESGMLRRGWASLANIFEPILVGTTYFRPLVMATFVAEFSIFSPTPLISHAINVLIHLANVAFVFALALKILDASAKQFNTTARPARVWDVAFRSGAATVFTLLYAIHPALVEAVAWVAGRFDLLATFFALATLFVATAKHDRIAAVGAAALTFLSLLCKEMAITLPILLLLQGVALGRTGSLRELSRRDVTVVGASLVGCAAYLLLRWLMMPGFLHAAPLEPSAAGFYARAVLMARSLVFYLRMIVYPYDQLEPVHEYRQSDLANFDLTNIGALVVLFFFVAAPLVVLLGRKRLSATGAIACAALLSLTPVLNLIPLTIAGDIGANRFLTLPLALFAISGATCVYSLVGRAVSGSGTSRVLGFAVISLCVISLIGESLFIRSTINIWRSDVALFSWTAERHPQNVSAGLLHMAALNNYVVVNPEALPQLDAAIQRFMTIDGLGARFPERAMPTVTAILVTLGHYREARWYADRFAEVRDAHTRLHLLIARAELQQHDRDATGAAATLHSAEELLLSLRDRRRVGFLTYARARQAILQRDTERLNYYVDELWRESSPQRFQEDVARLTNYRASLCGDHTTPADSALPCNYPELRLPVDATNHRR